MQMLFPRSDFIPISRACDACSYYEKSRLLVEHGFTGGGCSEDMGLVSSNIMINQGMARKVVVNQKAPHILCISPIKVSTHVDEIEEANGSMSTIGG